MRCKRPHRQAKEHSLLESLVYRYYTIGNWHRQMDESGGMWEQQKQKNSWDGIIPSATGCYKWTGLQQLIL